jgi:hypothetical protein
MVLNIGGVRCQCSGFSTKKQNNKLQISNKLQGPLYGLFLDQHHPNDKKRTAEYRISKGGIARAAQAPRVAQSFLK